MSDFFPSPARRPTRSLASIRHDRPRQRLVPTALAASLCACLASAPAWAQQAGTPAETAPAANAGTDAALPSVTVRGQAALAAPASVIDGDTLRQQRDTATLGAALDGEPGIQATHFGAGASRPVIRGMDGPRVQVLSNGATIQDASTISPDHAVTAEPMLADRIEVLRGPSALLYGPGAIGGMVNVIDERIPTAVPDKATGQIGLRAGTGAREKAGAFSLTGGNGPLAVHVEGAARDAGTTRSRTAPSPPPSSTAPTTGASMPNTRPSPAGAASSAPRARSAASAPWARRPTCAPPSPSARACSGWKSATSATWA